MSPTLGRLLSVGNGFVRRCRAVLMVTVVVFTLLIASPTGCTVQHDGRAAPLPRPTPATEEGWRVTRVIDGDTIEVSNGRRLMTVRLIGIDTPETVHPTQPIECFGPQASRFAARRLLGEVVELEFDLTQGRHDYYGRTLAYVWTTNPKRMFNLLAVRRGYAREYTFDAPYRWQPKFERAEVAARASESGVWDCPSPTL